MIAEKLLYAAVFVTEAITAWLYFSYIYTQTKSHLYTLICFVLGYTILFFASYVGAVLVNVVLFLAVNAIILLLNYTCERRSALLHAAFLTLMMSISEILVNIFITYATNDYTAYTHSFSAFISLFVFSKLLYLFITIVGARLFKPHKGFSEEPSQIVLLCVMPAVSIIIVVTFIYIEMIGRLTGLTEIMVTVSVFALLPVNIIVLFIYNRIQKLDEEHASFQIVQLRDQADAEYYAMLQQQYDGQRILIHDIKKHFNLIDLMAEDGDIQKIREYISELEELPEFRRKAQLCDDPILNMILIRYADQCADNNIIFSCDVRSGSVSFMDAIDITALFGNLLSNAVEAAILSEGRVVELSVIKNEQQNNVLVSMINSCDRAPIRDANGSFETIKDKRMWHGYGTKSIARVVLKYDGQSDMHYDETAKEFHSIIRFPVQHRIQSGTSNSASASI